MMNETYELSALFVVALLSGSVLPMQSEVLLAALLHTGNHAPWALLASASLGNTLGAMLNWWLGYACLRWQHRRWFPCKPEQLAKASRWFSRWGKWSLLLSWVPFIGDPLTIAAGAMRLPLATFTAIVAIAKTTRYVVILWVV